MEQILDNSSIHVWNERNEIVLRSSYPLHYYCRDGDLAMATVLLSSGRATPLSEDCFYCWTPFHWAACYGKVECLQKLACYLPPNGTVNIRSTRYSQTPLHIAALGGHTQCLLWLLQAGGDTAVQDYLGETPLHKAVRSGSIECVSILLLNNTDIGIKNVNGQTPVELSSVSGNTMLTELLRKINDCVSVQDAKNAQTFLQIAVKDLMGKFDLPSTMLPHFRFSGNGLNLTSFENNSIQNDVRIMSNGKRKRSLVDFQSEVCKKTKFEGSTFECNPLPIYSNGSFLLPAEGPMIPCVAQHQSSFGIQMLHDINRHIPRCLGHYI